MSFYNNLSRFIVLTSICHQEYGIVTNQTIKLVGMVEGLCLLSMALNCTGHHT